MAYMALCYLLCVCVCMCMCLLEGTGAMEGDVLECVRVCVCVCVCVYGLVSVAFLVSGDTPHYSSSYS